MRYVSLELGVVDMGAFRLREIPETGKIWIERISGVSAGEGGSFSIADLEKVVEAFYNEKF
jgi:hypothetical protein